MAWYDFQGDLTWPLSGQSYTESHYKHSIDYPWPENVQSQFDCYAFQNSNQEGLVCPEVVLYSVHHRSCMSPAKGLDGNPRLNRSLVGFFISRNTNILPFDWKHCFLRKLWLSRCAFDKRHNNNDKNIDWNEKKINEPGFFTRDVSIIHHDPGSFWFTPSCN